MPEPLRYVAVLPVAPMVRAKLGVPPVKAAAAIALAAIYGMTAPPINIPAMIIGGGIDMPYVGFGLPLLICTVPLAMGRTETSTPSQPP